ncbi:MAG: 1-acyl-sn-glycerol-3-phosphate acyltransferase [Odoribacteraceae bacterium]|jgi:1-acyl-sn-glycerol-3-phosphate acyltransferase|nr:1-acyl-sn-glycerol-3-phosphate acyltransferase [Odoribacteraceae bacterium]
MIDEHFDDLRPYRDEEIAPAMHRVADSEYFPLLSSFAYPGRDVEEVKAMIRGYTTIDEFQLQVMKVVAEQVIARSISRFSHDGIEKLDAGGRYLFISNHRDIVLDALLLQYALYRSGHRTSEITFGSNLMSSPLVVDIGKSNKMFKLVRAGNMKDAYANARRLSAYIRHALAEKRESIWIAQRNGRTKDGADATDQGIIKMFYMSSPRDPADALARLNIVPVSISYQWEPCDLLKAIECYHSRSGKYVKQPGEDLNSILTGVTQPKGEVHLRVGAPLSGDELAPLAALPHSKFNKQVAALIDKQINGNYRLTCNNYIAHDLRARAERHASRYTPAEKENFIRHYHQVLAADVEDKDLLGTIFLGIYANPVDARAAINGED